MKFYVSFLPWFSRPRNSSISHLFINLMTMEFMYSGHPWIVDDTVAPDKPLDSAVLSRLKKFSEMNKLKKMARRVCYVIMLFILGWFF